MNMNIKYDYETKITLFRDISVGEIFRDDDDMESIYIRIEDAIIDGEEVNCIDLASGKGYRTTLNCRCVLLVANLSVRDDC